MKDRLVRAEILELCFSTLHPSFFELNKNLWLRNKKLEGLDRSRTKNQRRETKILFSLSYSIIYSYKHNAHGCSQISLWVLLFYSEKMLKEDSFPDTWKGWRRFLLTYHLLSSNEAYDDYSCFSETTVAWSSADNPCLQRCGTSGLEMFLSWTVLESMVWIL